MPPRDPSSLTAEAFRAAVSASLPPLAPGTALGLSVSGGPDSLALAHLTAAAFPELRLRVAVVDHGLRPESAAEAIAVRQRLTAFLPDVDILTWKPPFAVMAGRLEKARLARFALLTDWARAQGILRVWLGHHADDQAETIALRQARGTGAVGARGMARRRVDPDVIFERPLLDWPKQGLVDYCRAQGLLFVLDPTNSDPRTGRGLLRQQAAAPATVSRPPEPSVDPSVRGSARGVVTDPMGYAWCRSDALDEATLSAVTAWVRGGFYAPSAERVAAACQRLQAEPRVSLHGCVVERRREGWSLITREARAGRNLRPQQDVDGRWRLDDRWALAGPGGDWTLAGQAGLAIDPTRPGRALAAVPLLQGQVPAWDGEGFGWADNHAVFAPRRPLLAWIGD